MGTLFSRKQHIYLGFQRTRMRVCWESSTVTYQRKLINCYTTRDRPSDTENDSSLLLLILCISNIIIIVIDSHKYAFMFSHFNTSKIEGGKGTYRVILLLGLRCKIHRQRKSMLLASSM